MSLVNEWGQPIGPPLPNWVVPPSPPRVRLTGRLCRLEPLEPEQHGRALFDALTDPASARRWTYLPYGPFENWPTFDAWLRAQSQKRDPLFYSIVEERSGSPSGLASYLRISPESGCIEVGHINFAPRLQRTPAATEAMYMMMKHAFELGYRRYEWKCDALNLPSRVAAERLGFGFEGIFRQATVYKRRSRDTAWYSIIDTEWPALQDSLERWLSPSNFDGEGQQRARLSELRAGN